MNNPDDEYYHEKKTHVSVNFPYNTYICTIPLDFTQVNTHWHNETEFIIIKKGCGKVCVDLQEYTVTSGDIILILPGRLTLSGNMRITAWNMKIFFSSQGFYMETDRITVLPACSTPFLKTISYFLYILINHWTFTASFIHALTV